MVPEFESLGITVLCKSKFEDMVQYVVAAPELTDAERQEFYTKFSTMSDSELGIMHMTLGMHLRNKFGLWRNSWTAEVDANGCDASKNHPDSISMEVIRQAHTVIADKISKGEIYAHHQA